MITESSVWSNKTRPHLGLQKQRSVSPAGDASEKTCETIANAGKACEDSPATRSLVVHDDHRVLGVVQQDAVHILATKSSELCQPRGNGQAREKIRETIANVGETCEDSLAT